MVLNSGLGRTRPLPDPVMAGAVEVAAYDDERVGNKRIRQSDQDNGRFGGPSEQH